MSLLDRITRRASHSTGVAHALPPVEQAEEKENDTVPGPSSPRKAFEANQELIEQARARSWFHTIDLGGGHFTPGPDEPQIEHLQRAFHDIDFQGKAVLDTGCWDGLWSFEAEKRGAAEVYSTDLVSQRDGDETGYRLAHAILNSRARYFPNVSVYDLHTLPRGEFDIVLFAGIFYHIRDPLLALARLRQATRVGGLILIEGEVIRSDRSFAEFYYQEPYARSTSNWWVPTIPCLRQWVESSFFEVVGEYTERAEDEAYWQKRGGYGRQAITARALPVPRRGTDDLKNYYARYDFLEPA